MANKKTKQRKTTQKEGFIRQLLNYLVVGILIFLAHLPFWIIFGISDILYVLMRFVVKYRHKVITENLKHAFPEKSEDEISSIRNKFYRHFCDLIFESIKMYGLSPSQMEKHISFKGLENSHQYVNRNQSIIILATHHNNWEWCSFSQTKLKHRILMVYNPFRENKIIERFILRSREKWGGESVPVHRTARTTINYNLKGKLTGLWLAADQTPPANSKFWTIFLNREAPFFTGPEKLAIKTNQPVFFQYVKKVKRSKYIAEYTPLFEEPNKVEEKDILLGYIRKMEEVIRKEPEFYLWSHRRWKHNRPENIPLTL